MTNVFLESVISDELTREEKAKLSALTSEELQNLLVSRSVQPFRTLFKKDTTAFITKVKLACLDEKNLRGVQKPVMDGKMSAVWQGKASVDLEPVRDTFQLVVKTTGGEVKTGTGPIVSMDVIPAYMQRCVHFISCYTIETKDEGIKSLVDQKVAEKFPEYRLEGMSAVVTMLEGVKREMNIESANLSGLKWQEKLVKVVSLMSTELQVSMNNIVIINVLKAATIDKAESKKEKVPVWQRGEVAEPFKEMKVPVKVGKKTRELPLLGWTGNLKPQIKFLIPMNPKKGVEGFATEIGWAQDMTSMMGATNIPAMCAAVNLCPGLTSSEASVIRFVTVALAVWKNQVMKVLGDVSQLTMLYFSFIAMLKAKKMTETEAKSLIKESICYSRLNLKASAIAILDDMYASEEDLEPAVFVGWCPRKFSSAKTAVEVEKANAKYYKAFYEQADGIKSIFMYKEVIVPNESATLYADGYSDLFNVWEVQGESPLECMEKKGALYYAVKMSPIGMPMYKFAFQTARMMMSYAMHCPTKRSHRILAVVGSKKLSTVSLESLTDVLGVGDNIDNYEQEARLVALKAALDEEEEEVEQVLSNKKPAKKPPKESSDVAEKKLVVPRPSSVESKKSKKKQEVGSASEEHSDEGYQDIESDAEESSEEHEDSSSEEEKKKKKKKMKGSKTVQEEFEEMDPNLFG